MTNAPDSTKPTNAVQTVRTEAAVPPATESVKETPEKYQKRIGKMSDRQLVSEIRKQKKTLTDRHIQYKLCSVLEILMESHKRGMTPFLRG